MKNVIGKSFSEHYRKRLLISKEKEKMRREKIYKESVDTMCVICHDTMSEDVNIITKCFQCFDKRKNSDKKYTRIDEYLGEFLEIINSKELFDKNISSKCR